MHFYAKSDKLLHIQHPLEVRLVLRTTVLLFMVINGAIHEYLCQYKQHREIVFEHKHP